MVRVNNMEPWYVLATRGSPLNLTKPELTLDGVPVAAYANQKLERKGSIITIGQASNENSLVTQTLREAATTLRKPSLE